MSSKGGNPTDSFRTYQPAPNLLFDVVPINSLDKTNLVKPWVITYSVYLTGRLDSAKLHDSLESLISKKHRILGARLVSAILFRQVNNVSDAPTPRLRHWTAFMYLVRNHSRATPCLRLYSHQMTMGKKVSNPPTLIYHSQMLDPTVSLFTLPPNHFKL